MLAFLCQKWYNEDRKRKEVFAMMRMMDYFEQFLMSRHISLESFYDVPGDEVPFPMGTEEACRILSESRQLDIPVGIFSDFDCDGLMSGLLWYLGLRLMGFSTVYLCPRDVGAGYVPNVADLSALPPSTGLLVTSDVGSVSNDLVQCAKNRGMRVIVTDHHDCRLSDSVLGKADAFVNPMTDAERGNAYAGPRICGAQVVYLILLYYFTVCCPFSAVVLGDLSILRHFASVAVVSDNMPLCGANFAWVRSMLGFFQYMNPMLPEGESATASGLANDPFVQNACLNFHRFVHAQQGSMGNAFDMDFLEYQIIPVINSIKRMAGDVSLFYHMLLGTPEQNEACIEILTRMNQDRKLLVNAEFERLQEERDTGQSCFSYLSILPENVPSGICGLVAQKMAEAYGIPYIAVQKYPDGSYAGSARTFGMYPFKSEVSGSGFARCGGHEEACGISFLSYGDMLFLDSFLHSSFQDYLSSCEDMTPGYDVLIDYELDFDHDFRRRINRFVSELSMAGPFGKDNPPPLVLMRIPLSQCVLSEFGSESAPHCRISVGYGVQCILWRTDVFSVADAVQEDYLYLAGTMARHESADSRSIRFTCVPALSCKDIFSSLASQRMECFTENDGDDFAEESEDMDL